MRSLFLGYGNQDRQDDGVAWHILVELKKLMHLPSPENLDEDFDSIADLVFVFQLQLTPEMAEDISKFDQVCFIDAHTGAVPEDIHFECLSAEFQRSPLTHHLTANSLLSIVQTLYGTPPHAILLSVRGYEFGFSQQLSLATGALVPKAATIIYNWINKTAG